MSIKKYNFTHTSFFTGNIFRPKNIRELKKYLNYKHTIIGNQRSYGDTFIGKSKHIALSKFNKVLSLDEKNKIVEVQSGTSLLKLNNVILKKNFILTCAPGCKYVSIGGIIANNISGKLVYKNSIKHYIHSIKIINEKLKLIECSRQKNKKLFYLTIGGKGITGPIISAKLKLEKISSEKIFQKNLNFKNYKQFFLHLKKLKKYKYAVCWLDFTKKNFSGIIFVGNHLKGKNNIKNIYNDIKLSRFFTFMVGLFIHSKIFTFIFNNIFKFKNLIFSKRILRLNEYFFPQNKILNWNDFFKRGGFVQFQIYFKRNEMLKIIENLKKDFQKHRIFSNFAIIKFHNNNKTANNKKFSLSLDIPLKRNFNEIKEILNYHVEKFDLGVELSKDIILKKLNKKTLRLNPIFKPKSKKYLLKNYDSNIFKRLKI